MRTAILAFLLLAACGGAGYSPAIDGPVLYAYSKSTGPISQVHFQPGTEPVVAVDVGPLHRDYPAGPLVHHLGDIPSGRYTVVVTFADRTVTQTFDITGEWFVVVAE